MALTTDDVKTIEGLLEKQRADIREDIRTATSGQNRMISQGFADLKAVMEQTYVKREEFEEKYNELQNEFEDLAKRIDKRLEKLEQGIVTS